MKKPMEAIVYARFSKAEQGAGASAARQIDMIQRLCAERGWTTDQNDPSRWHIAEGQSAFTGSNRDAGTWLHNFEREVEIGLHRGRVFCVESIDRITRQGHDAAQDFVRKLTSNGVTVATAAHGRVLQAYQAIGMIDVVGLIMSAELAREESAQKQRRVIDGKKKKREAVMAGSKAPLTKMVPSWLVVRDGAHHLIPERVELVQEIFRLAAGGAGTYLIAQILNDRGIPCWNGKPGGWQAGTIHRLLMSRSVLGEYQSIKYKERVLDYYPAAISPDLFNQVAAKRQERKQKTTGRWTHKHTNLFAGRTRCFHCDRQMTTKDGWVNKDGLVRRNLICFTAVRKLRDEAGNFICHNKTRIRLDLIESTILDEVLKLALDNDRFSQREASDARVALAETDRLIEFKREQASKLGENLKHQVSDTLLNILIGLESEIKGLQNDRIKLMDQAAADSAVTSPAMLARIADTRERIESEDRAERAEARSMVADALRAVISDIQCKDDRSVMVTIAHGLAAFQMDGKGVVNWRYDASGDEQVVDALTSHSLEGNAPAVNAVLRRAKALHN